MRDIVGQHLARSGAVGAAVAVVHGDEVLLADGFGSTDVDSPSPVTAETAFCVGSTTKAFTAALVAALVDDGTLEWDRPVRHYLEGFSMHDPLATERLTVRDMLSHRSGLPRHDLLWYGNDDWSRAELVARLRHLAPNADLRTRYQYNNLLYIAAGHLCEIVTGSSWEELIRSRLLVPLGMNATTFSPEQSARAGAVAAAHATRDGRTSRVPYARGTALAGPAGSLCAPVVDLLPWMRLLLGQLGDDAPVSPAGIREILTPQIVMREPGLFPEQREWAYGMGWVLGDYRGRRHAQHSGTVDGFTALISLIPEERLGVAVLANVHGNPLPWSLTYSLTDHVLQLQDAGWVERYAAVHRALQEATGGPDRTATAPLPDDCLGTYTNPAYGDLVVSSSSAGALATLHGVELTLTPGDADTVTAWHAFHRRQMSGVFSREADGVVTAVELALEPESAALRFTRRKE